jgi:hypothetical protein
MLEAERGSTNVYADLGDPDADEMLVKAQLATRIGFRKTRFCSALSPINV